VFDPTARCAVVARALGEPLHATASRVRSWLLLEQPGPWGREALLQSRLPAALAAELRARAGRAGVRLLLLRRPGGGGELPRRCFAAVTSASGAWLQQWRLDDPVELLDLDLARLAAGERPRLGEVVPAPLYLVCTNGRHDRCCALDGRVLAQALVPAVGERVWECSHVGGDRFAGNLVCLPAGVYYGRVEPAAAAGVVALHEDGRIDLARYRGRCWYPPVVQAAEHFLRRASRLERLDDLAAVAREDTPGGVVAVRFTTRNGPRLVRVQRTTAPPPRPLTCNATRLVEPPAYRLLEVAAA
jgi:hypothetical protein